MITGRFLNSAIWSLYYCEKFKREGALILGLVSAQSPIIYNKSGLNSKFELKMGKLEAQGQKNLGPVQ